MKTLLKAAQKTFADLIDWLRDPSADRGDRPLRHCDACGLARHDVDDDGYCEPCFRVAI